jgi:hypothetical protein
LLLALNYVLPLSIAAAISFWHAWLPLKKTSLFTATNFYRWGWPDAYD